MLRRLEGSCRGPSFLLNLCLAKDKVSHHKVSRLFPEQLTVSGDFLAGRASATVTSASRVNVMFMVACKDCVCGEWQVGRFGCGLGKDDRISFPPACGQLSRSRILGTLIIRWTTRAHGEDCRRFF